MKARIWFLLLLALWPNFVFSQSANDEITIVYKGVYYKKAKVVGVTEAGVTLNSDKGRVTVPMSQLPYSMQDELKQRLANSRATAQRAATPQPAKPSTPVVPSASEEAEAVKKPVKMDMAMIRDSLIAGGLGIVGCLFLLGALFGSKKLVSFIVMLLCFGGAYFPGKKVYDRYTAQEMTVEQAQQEAMRLYPDLARQGTKFNSVYLDLHNKYRAEDPSYFETSDWPLRLAHEVNDSL